MFWIIWLVLLFALFIIPLGWGYPRYGTPRPSYRRGSGGPGGPVVTHESAAGWGIWATVLWAVLIVLVVWAVIALLF